MAQTGNELNGGPLWPDGRYDNWPGMNQALFDYKDRLLPAVRAVR